MKQPLVTIVIPIHNGQEYIERCVKSAVNQTYQNLEMILVNDGSKDRSAILIDEWMKRDERIKVIHQQNKGLSGARNSGINVCTGEFITFVDVDDYISSDYIEFLVRVAVENKADIVQCDFKRGKSSQHVFLNQQKPIKVMDGNDIFFSKEYKTSACAKLFRIELFEEVRFPEREYLDDEGTVYKTYYLANKVVYIYNKLYYVYMSDNSLTRNLNKISMNFFDTLEQRLQYFIEKGEQDLYELSLVRFCLTLAIKASRIYCNKKNTKTEYEKVKRRFNELYIVAIKSKYLRKKYKYVIQSFHAFPRLYAKIDDIVVRIMRKCGSY